ncbi:MAG: hypothetical protein KF858_08850 [Candidatus Sumerlaeia bacterium]|nr:hypothetical protein [Candidatus Sumerlaeia bacterium]
MTMETRARWSWRVGVAFGLLLLACVQLGPLVHERPEGGATWFLFGLDTVGHDVPVQMWVWHEVAHGGGTMPLWMPPLKGGLPTVGAFLWTPLAPTLWLHTALPFALAQRLQFVLALWWAGLGGYWLARELGMARAVAVLTAVACAVSGHLVTLIHAGHLQKVLALAWVPWFAGGMVRLFAGERAAAVRVTGVAAAGVALGMAFLCGHPQVAYTMMALLGLRAGFELAWPATKRRVVPVMAGAGAVVVLGLLVGGGQLVPGSEMGALSNRAAGVTFEEAVATSYPPSEVFEFVLPRFRGDSSAVGHGVYHGAWGERLVSDYAGALVVVLALLAFVRCVRRREAAFWLLTAAAFLVVGFGSHTPVYRVLYDWLPGLDRFRSPGTFFAGVALALPVLAGLGLEACVEALQRPGRSLVRRVAGIVAALGILGALAAWWGHDGASQEATDLMLGSLARTLGLVAFGSALVVGATFLRTARALALALPLACAGATAGDLATANAAFLRAVDWDSWALYAAPGELDDRVMRLPEPRRVFEPGRELSLRPLLVGRDALLAYHPISFAAYEAHLAATPFDSVEWRAAWGVQHVWYPGPLDDLAGSPFEVVASLAGPPRAVLLRDTRVPAPVRAVEGASEELRWHWLERTPNRQTLEAACDRPLLVEVAETIAPGWRWRVGDGDWQEAPEVALTRRVALEAGAHQVVWEYRPRAWRVGLWMTALGLGMSGALLMGGRRR